MLAVIKEENVINMDVNSINSREKKEKNLAVLDINTIYLESDLR